MDQLPPQLDDLIERIDHVSMAVWSLAAAVPFADLIGGRFRSGGIQRRDNFKWAQWDLPGGKLEMVQPLDPDDDSNFLVRFLNGRGEGLHHLTVKVSDIDLAVDRARELGFEVTGYNAEHEDWKEAFVHPASSNGVLVQLAEFTDTPMPERTLDDVISMR